MRTQTRTEILLYFVMVVELGFSPEISNGVKLERHFKVKDERMLAENNPGLREGEQSDQD